MTEPVIDPDRPIVDPHLHLWDIPAVAGGLQEPQRFLLPNAAEAIAASGHNVTHTVFVECHAMYRPHGCEALRSLGQTEFATGMAAMAASGRYGPALIAHRIVGSVDLGLGDGLRNVLDIHRAVAGERFRGVRMNTCHSEAGLFGSPAEASARSRLIEPSFVEGARVLAQEGLSLDVWCLHTQLPQLIQLADRVPELEIVLDHVGTPDLRGDPAGHDAVLAEWRKRLRELALRRNVRIKLSGLGMDIDRPIGAKVGMQAAETLADQWRDRVQTAIEAFTPERAMFASNFPPDQSAGFYRAVWNAFKRLAEPYSDSERDFLFQRTAAETYRIPLDI